MRLKKRFVAVAGGVALVLVLAVSITAVSALSSSSFELSKNTAGGAYPAGSVLTSADFSLATGFGGPLKLSMSSSSFNLCTGFLCGLKRAAVYQPVMTRDVILP